MLKPEFLQKIIDACDEELGDQTAMLFHPCEDRQRETGELRTAARRRLLVSKVYSLIDKLEKRDA